MALVATAGPAGAEEQPVGSSLAREFAEPGAEVRPEADWFLPESLSAIDAGQLRREVPLIADAGFGGSALFSVDLALTADRNDLLETALRGARRHGITLDLTIGSAFPPVGVPTIGPDSPFAQQELVYGTAAVAGGDSFNGPVPEPATEPAKPRSLVAVVAARCSAACTRPAPVLLDEDSLVDLTDTVQGGAVDWTAPAGGDWLLFGFWSRATETTYADYFSSAATDAVTDYWDEHAFTPEVDELLEDAGSEIFEDSIHLQGFHLWSPDLLREFRQRRGYSLRRYLPATIIASLNDFPANVFFGSQALSPDAPADFDFAGDLGRRIRNDYYQTLSELYEEHHLVPLNEWARSHGLEYRAKPSYGASFDISAATLVDVPNTESFQHGNRMDGNRSIAGAVHLGRKRILAVECCPTATRAGQDFLSATWQQMLNVIHRTYAAGANQVQITGFSYGDDPNAAWPGGSWPFIGIFGPGYADEFGPWMPYWEHMPEINDFLAREQRVLREGEARVDVAIYRHSYWSHGFPILPTHQPQDDWFKDKTLERAGYSYDFVGPALLERPNARVHGRRLDRRGPAYKALVLDTPEQAVSVDGMPLAAARRILAYARAGLPVIVVGEAPDRTGFFADVGDDQAVRRTIARLLEEPTVRQVATEADVAGALGDMRARPDFGPAQPANVVSAHRSRAGLDLYFLHNQDMVHAISGEPDPEGVAFDQRVSLVGHGRPYVLDAWTGEIAPIGSYEQRGGRVSTRVRLAPGESTIVAIARGGGLHATGTTADEVVAGGRRGLRIRDTEPGTYTTTLSNGRTVSSTIGPLPAAKPLASWHLSVDDYQPGATPTETVKVKRELDLQSLEIWPSIPELQDVSGVGRYTTRVNLDPSWRKAGRGARLELGPLFDSVRVKVNGRRLPAIDRYDPVVDVSAHLRPGVNTIEVEVATTLRNRARTVPAHAEVFAGVDRQPYGLAGPVRLVPYGEAPIRTGGGR